MFKFAMKFMVLTLIVLGVSMSLSQSKASAATCNWAPGNMGFHEGEAQDGFAGLIVDASVGNMTNGAADPTHAGDAVDVAYQLNSQLPGLSNPAADHYQPLPAGADYGYDARIFQLDASGNTTGRSNNHTFRTGEDLYAGGAPFSCDGWSAIGPGTAAEVGDQFGLDCGEAELDSNNNKVQTNQTHFWISNIPNAYNQDGYWEIQIPGVGDYVNGTMSYQTSFTVPNGASQVVHLIWHRTPPVPPQQPSTGSCLNLQVSNNGFVYTNAGGSHPTAEHVVGTGMTVGKINGQPNAGTNIDGYSPDSGNGGNGTKTWDYIPYQNSITVTKIQQWKSTNGVWNDIPGALTYYLDANGNWTTQPTSITCFQDQIGNPVCSSIQATGSEGPNGNLVLVNGTIHVHATLLNTSADGLQLWYPSLEDSNGIVHPSDVILPAGATHDFYFDIPAPSSVQTYNFSLFPVYYGQSGPTCNVSVDVYQQFAIQPTANYAAGTNPEDPHEADNPSVSGVSYTVGGYLQFGPTINGVSTIGSLTKNGTPVNPCDSTDSYGVVSHQCDFADSVNAGDQYCPHVTVYPATGYLGPGGIANPAAASADGSCLTVVNKPYTSFAGSDVSAGGGFGQSCPATEAGNINTYDESSGSGTGGKGGSGAQFGAEAVSIITGLGSANLRTTPLPGVAAASTNGLTFANSNLVNAGGGVVPLGGSPPNSTNGGYLNNPGAFCVPDYFSDMSTATAAAVSTAPSATTGTTSYMAYYKPGGGTLTLNAAGATTIPNKTNQTIFVDGNVDIKNNISYDSTARGSVTDIPSFYLIVKGNIHIEPNVTRLDGVYVAQPTSNTPPVNTGIINTCWVGAATNIIYNSCKNQLVINGAFVANKVLLTRSYSSLRYSQNGEHDLGGYASHNCGNVGLDVPSVATKSAPDCASEIFNFNPELYMSQPSLNPRFGAASQKFDAFTSLSPVL